MIELYRAILLTPLDGEFDPVNGEDHAAPSCASAPRVECIRGNVV
jgi:hypothetical protein